MDRLVTRAGACIEARKDRYRLYHAWHIQETSVRTIFPPTRYNALESGHLVNPQHQLYQERLKLSQPPETMPPAVKLFRYRLK